MVSVPNFTLNIFPHGKVGSAQELMGWLWIYLLYPEALVTRNSLLLMARARI